MISLDEKRRRLIEAVALIACEPADQLAVFPEWVARVDEIALSASDCFLFANELRKHGKITEEQVKAIQMIDQELSAMSGPQNAALWTEESLAMDANWQKLRLWARELLVSLGAVGQRPHFDWQEFVQ